MMNFVFRKIGSESRGFTLIDIMVAMGLGSIAVVTTIAVISQASKVRRIENLRSSAVAAREQLIKNLGRYDNFQETIHHSSNATQFACLLAAGGRNCGAVNLTGWNAGDTATANGSNFNLRLAAGGTSYTLGNTAFYNAATTSEGFTDEGIPCSQTTPVPTGTAPNRRCPIRADLYWWNLCSNACDPGLIGIKVEISTYNDLTKQTVMTNYGFRLIKSVFPPDTQGPYPGP